MQSATGQAGTLTASGIEKAYGKRVVLKGVTLRVSPRTRLGVVGPNGIGKSTLLRVLAGVDRADAGRIDRDPATLTVGYLPQELDARQDETVAAYIARRTGVSRAEAEVDRLAAALEADASRVDEYGDALERFLVLGGDDLRTRAEVVVEEIGLGAGRLDQRVDTLSAGQAARAQLAAILLSRFGVLLLDEPTNNLDFAGLERLERFAAEAPCGIAVISHDRAFLDRVVTRIFEIAEDNLGGRELAGGWSEFVEARELARRHQQEAYERFSSEKGRLEQRMLRQRQWAEKGVRNLKKKRENREMPRIVFGAKVDRTEKQASKVRATERAIERLEEVDKPFEPWRLQLRIAPAQRSGDVVARLEGAVVRRGTFTLGPLDVEVASGETVAILGPNGAGKTTLLDALLGELPLDEGKRYLGPSVVVGEMDQARSVFAGDRALLESFRDASGLRPAEARTLLAKFGLGAGHVLRPGGSLSPGERSRATLAALMARGVNCLVLDEPTNHLDLPAIEQLEGVLNDFEGTVLLVTHDRWLLDRVQPTRTIQL